METLKIKIQSILEKYKQKRDKFKKVIDRWGQKNYTTDHRNAMELFNKAENYAANLMQEASNPGVNKKELKSTARNPC